MSDIYSEIKKYFVILYDGDRANHIKKIQRVFESELREGIDYTREGKDRVMTEAQAFRFVTTNASIRSYFLDRMDDYPDAISDHFHKMDVELIATRFDNMPDASWTSFDKKDIAYDAELEELERYRTTTTQDIGKRILLDMLASISTDALYDYFEIDRQCFIDAYRLYKVLLAVDEPYGVSELRYKLQRPTIYFHRGDCRTTVTLDDYNQYGLEAFRLQQRRSQTNKLQ